MSVLRPHPILSTAGTSYEVNKMIVQVRMLSGRYRVGTLLRHFSPSNTSICELCDLEVEDIAHLLVPRCTVLQERKMLLMEYSNQILKHHVEALNIFHTIFSSNEEETQVQFLLDCSVFPSVIQASQKNKLILPALFKVTHTWCYSMHRTRLKLLNRWTT